MAKPIPADFDLRHLSRDVKPEDNFFDKTLNNFSKGNGKDLVLGTIGGWITGVGIIKVGKTAAVGLGGSILLLHFATELGYLCVNWDKVREAMSYSQELMDAVLRFVRKNSCFSVGFVGGFFFGVGST
ncbi:unnamed protein product [Pieris brassicae]|uniref:FUN14 domain-containing protein 1 n=1 Tax=Pieris brassicae TaxID=7116 RepID=A0A9P0SVZ7_PIEBR|nr:unnamed protein product [Pieris brassicae]